jgi:hypothetical protein
MQGTKEENLKDQQVPGISLTPTPEADAVATTES